MQLYCKTATMHPKGCRATRLGRPAPSGINAKLPPRLREIKAGQAIEARVTEVIAVTYNDDLTLIICRYSASSMSGFAAGPTSGEIRD